MYYDEQGVDLTDRVGKSGVLRTALLVGDYFVLSSVLLLLYLAKPEVRYSLLVVVLILPEGLFSPGIIKIFKRDRQLGQVKGEWPPMMKWLLVVAGAASFAVCHLTFRQPDSLAAWVTPCFCWLLVHSILVVPVLRGTARSKESEG